MTVADYLKLITSEHFGKPLFAAYVAAVAGYPVDSINLLAAMPGDFDIDNAIGVQLDAVGEWVGLPRLVTIQPSVAYPAAGPYQYVFDDAGYRRLLKARAVANKWDGTPAGIVTILAAYYAPAGSAGAVVDNQDMSIDLILAGTFPTAAEAAVFSQMLLPVRPSTVRIRDTHISPVGGPLFGLDFENTFIAGPDVGSFGVSF